MAADVAINGQLATAVADPPQRQDDEPVPGVTAGSQQREDLLIAHVAGKLVTTVTGHDGQPREQVFDRLAVVPYAYRHSQLRDLIRRIEADVDGLTQQDQAMIAEAVSVIRKTRQLVNLGMPAVRPAAKSG